MYQKSQSYEVQFVKYGVIQTEFFVILDYFYPFNPLTTQKIEILKKWKKCLQILSFYTCVPKITIIWCMTVCSYHVMYVFQSESTHYSCLNVKELLAWSRRKIWSLSDCNWTQTHNHLACKQTLNHLAK